MCGLNMCVHAYKPTKARKNKKEYHKVTKVMVSPGHDASELYVYVCEDEQARMIEMLFLYRPTFCCTTPCKTSFFQRFSVSLRLRWRVVPALLYPAIRKMPDRKITKERGLREKWAAPWFGSIVCVCFAKAFLRPSSREGTHVIV